MKTANILISLIILCGSLVGQQDRSDSKPGSVDLLAPANDAALKRDSARISSELSRNIREVRRELEKAKKKIPNLLPDQFVATDAIAQAHNLQPAQLFNQIAVVALQQHVSLAATAKPIPDFADLLGKALHNTKAEIPQNSAKEEAQAALAKAQAALTSQTQ